MGFCLIVAVLAFGNALVDLFFFEEHLWQVQATLEATQGQILSQSPTEATSGRWYLNGN